MSFAMVVYCRMGWRDETNRWFDDLGCPAAFLNPCTRIVWWIFTLIEYRFKTSKLQSFYFSNFFLSRTPGIPGSCKKGWQPILVVFSRRCVRTDLAKKKRLADLEAMHQAAAEDYWNLGSVKIERGGLNCENLHWIAMKPPSNLEFYDELYILSVVPTWNRY